MSLTPFFQAEGQSGEHLLAEIFESARPNLCKKGLLMTDETTPLVVEIAKEFMSFLQASGQPWSKGFFRFKSDDDNYGSNASYVVGEDVNLISAIRHKSFYERMNETGRNLVSSFGKTRGLFLIIVDSNFDYEIKFEWNDLSKWEITKIDQNTGVPAGI